MSALVLACGNDEVGSAPRLFTQRDGVDVRALPATPGRAEIDPLLRAAEGGRVVVLGTDADLAAVALRLLRTDRLDRVAVGFVAADPRRSQVARLWGLPEDPERAAELALDGEVDPVPLVRDDTGGVLVGRGLLRQVRGVAYCDDTTALRGRASRVVVTPDPDGGEGLVVRVVRVNLFGKRVQTFRGRAFQVGCLPVVPVHDGVPHPREASRWTWYRHTSDLRLVRGLI